MKVLWICGLPNEVRLHGDEDLLSPVKTPAWSWIVGHLPPPDGVDLHILCPVLGLRKERVDFEYLGAQWHCFRQKRLETAFLWIRFYLSIRDFVHALSPDIIHGWGGESGCGLLATFCSNRAIVSVQGILQMLKRNMLKYGLRMRNCFSFRGLISHLLERAAYHRAYCLFTESEISHDSLQECYGKNGIVIPQPLRRSFIEHKYPASKPRTPIFIYVGEMINRKGTMDTLSAFADLSMPARLVMIGSGELNVIVDSYLDEHGLKNRVRHIEYLPAEGILAEFDSAQFFVLPSYGDTGPTAVKEALAQGLYPICYDNTGPKELITRYCGSLVPTGDVMGLTKAMEDAAVRMSECGEKALRASARIRKDMSSESVWNILQKQYRIILNEN